MALREEILRSFEVLSRFIRLAREDDEKLPDGTGAHKSDFRASPDEERSETSGAIPKSRNHQQGPVGGTWCQVLR